MNLRKNIRRILKEEMDGWEWARGVKPKYTVYDIKHFLNKPFKLYKTETGELDKNTGGVKDGIYWMEENQHSPKEYDVCWNTLTHEKACVSYSVVELANKFNGTKYWTWKFVD